VVAVGDSTIELSPGGAVRTGIDTLGHSDKPILLTGIVVFTLLLGMTIGGARRPRLALAGGFGSLTAVALWAAARESSSAMAATTIVYLLVAAAGAAVVLGLWKLAGGVATRPSEVRVLPATAPDQPPGRTPPDAQATPTDPPATRRAFLTFAGAGAAFAVVGAVGGAQLRGRSSVESARRTVVLPPTADPAGSLVATGGSFDDIAGISKFVTSARDFYRIDTALLVPQVAPDRWRLKITGLVDRETTFTLDDLLAMPLVEQQITMACVSNEVGGELVGTASWRGVPLSQLLAKAGVKPTATQVIGESADGFTAGFPVGVALDGRPALVVVGMNGQPLPVEHGFPARLVVAGLYGYVSATKWLTELRLTTWEDEQGYWIPRGWSRDGPIKTQSRIDVPHSGAKMPAGTVAVAGVAWAPTRGITRVEVQVDDGPWQEAQLAPSGAATTWTQWVYRWPAVKGSHHLKVRATDGTGAVQPAQRRDPAPNGATGEHTISVQVT
jgi:DMSO/TMAO reductase YedYZ molybdopterin-dependent catalytic subunit